MSIIPLNLKRVRRVQCVASFKGLGRSKASGHLRSHNLEVFWNVWNRRLAVVFWPICRHSEASYKWCNRACAMIAMERREEYLFPIPMFTSLPYSPPLRSKAYRIATIPYSFCTYSIVPFRLQGSLQSPTVSPSVVA